MKKLIVFLLAVALTTMLSANNITISNLSLTGQNTTSQYSLVQFDISWENSWRTSSASSNWDAAWVFVKYRVPISSGGDGLWKHAWLNDEGHTAPDGSNLDIGLLTPGTTFNTTTNPGLGAFIYRSTDGTGTTGFTGAQLRWNYGENYKTGTTPIGDNDVIDIQVYAIEMVYVPTGNFYVGDGSTSYVYGQFNDYNSTAAFQITSESVPTTLGGSASGNMRNHNAAGMSFADDFNNSTTKSLQAAFPKGYTAFYCMKYEISQQGYVDFLNSLTQTQATTRKYTSTGARYAITGSLIGSYTTTNPYVACNLLSWADIAAYLDWSGLRPMTELEFEKACRGTESASAGEYAWGNATVSATAYTFSGSTAGTSSEVVSNPASGTTGNANYTATSIPNIGGPLRVGSFATIMSDRIGSGATYYGIMEMSGNLAERTVTVGKTAGRDFTGIHGDGALDNTGNANATTWPGTNAIGIGLRGGTYNLGWLNLRVSDRIFAVYALNGRASDAGGRGVRAAPVFTFYIGQSYGGGIIFYIDGTGQHGLIAATSDQSTGAEWGCMGTLITGADGTAIGTGNQNTIDILAGCSTAGIAARICDDFVKDGYSDWYLPSKDELNEMYLQKGVIGGFAYSDYWSSTENDANTAWYQEFINTSPQYNSDKLLKMLLVRAIRSF